MKTVKMLMGIIGIVAIASCSTSAGEKSKGSYTGTYAIDSTSSYPVSGTVVDGTVNIAKVNDASVDMTLATIPASLIDVSNNVTATLNGDVVSFSFTSSSIIENDMIELNGTLNGNTLTLHGVMYMSGGNGIGTFTGTK